MPQEGIEGALETNAELPARPVAVRHQVDGIDATLGQHPHPDSLREGLPDGIGQYFDGHLPVQLGIVGEVHFAHATFSQGADDFIMGYLCTGIHRASVWIIGLHHW